MTNADRIREMTDEELAELFVNVVSQRDQWWANNLKDVDFELVEIPICSAKIHLDWLREEADDGT